LAVYNLATDRLINYGQDIQNQTYFQDERAKLRIFDARIGVPSSVNDNGTAVGVLNPEFLKNVTLADLQYLKTPFGRAYIEIAQTVGTVWGVS